VHCGGAGVARGAAGASHSATRAGAGDGVIAVQALRAHPQHDWCPVPCAGARPAGGCAPWWPAAVQEPQTARPCAYVATAATHPEVLLHLAPLLRHGCSRCCAQAVSRNRGQITWQWAGRCNQPGTRGGRVVRQATA
jgi:hypothetical protein